MARVYLNGRFASRPITGVQRFAVEMTAALSRLWLSEAADDRLIMLVPPGAPPNVSFGSLPVRRVGIGRGHVWEQFELPRYACDGILLNLANAAPVLARRQVVVIHDAGVFTNAASYSMPYRLWHQRLGRALSRSGARIVTVSSFSRDELATHLQLEKDTITVISEGADHLLRVPADPSILAEHGLRPGGYVVAVGSLAAHKNLASLDDTAGALKGRGVELVLVGGMGGAILERETALPRPARMLGRINDGALRALYEHAAALVFPSRYEGFGLPPVEAMSCGCPVVASTAPAVVEICRDAALYCDPNDRAGIAATVQRLLDDATLASEMRTRGRARVRTLTWDNAARALLPVLRADKVEALAA